MVFFGHFQRLYTGIYITINSKFFKLDLFEMVIIKFYMISVCLISHGNITFVCEQTFEDYISVNISITPLLYRSYITIMI